MSMNGYEKLIKTMREEAKGQYIQPFTFGTMKEDWKIDVGEVELEPEMYKRLDGLMQKTKVSISGWETTARFTTEEYELTGTLTFDGKTGAARMVSGSGETAGTLTVDEYETTGQVIIEPGDTVFLVRLSEEQFLLVGKVEA